MKRIIPFIFFMTLAVLGVISCGKDEVTPTVAFDFTTDKLKTTFSNKSKDAESYTWNFGDGKTSTDANPTHTYAKNGTYKVKLTAKNDDKTATASKDVLVNDGVDRSAQPAFNIDVEYLKVTFTNSSINATSYAWDFGDGNTSTEKDPSHTYVKNGTYSVKLTATGSEGSKDLTKDITVTSQYKQSGYFLGSVTSTSANSTYYGGYFETLPREADLTAKKGYQRINMIGSYKGFMYGWRTDNQAGFVKYAIDGETEELVEVGEITKDFYPWGLVFINDELAYTAALASTDIVVFNPKTMEIIKNVDLSSAKSLDGFDVMGYSGLYHNPKTGKIYAVANVNNRATAKFYDLDDIYVEVIDAATGNWEKTIVQENAQDALMRGEAKTVIDAEGNLYLICQGTYGLDQQIGPSAGKGSRPQILKINTNSEFDKDYAFNPINKLGFQNNFFQLFTQMIGTGTNIAYGIGTAQVDSPKIQALLGKLAAETITTEEYNQLVTLVLYDESMRILQIDLASKEVKFVDGAPKTAGFGYPEMHNSNGKIYTTMLSNGGTFNGFYEIDPATNTARPVTSITAGGIAVDLVDLGASF